jgi:hypothetical protein
MLARARFGDDARLAHFHRQQPLANGIVDFVRPGMQQVFALQVNPRAAKFLRKTRSELQRRRPPGEILQQTLKLRLEGCIRFRKLVSALQLEERYHECFRHVTAAVGAKASWRCRRRLQYGAH